MSSRARILQQMGALLTCSEIQGLINRLSGEATLSQALVCVRRAKAPTVRRLIEGLGLPSLGVRSQGREYLVEMLSAMVGAKEKAPVVSPVWTAPELLATGGPLNSARDDLVRGARLSVVCSTYNFHRSSSLWEALCEVSGRAGMSVKLYVDTSVADGRPSTGKLTTREIARELGNARVYRTKSFSPSLPPVCNHAKFIAIDHRLIVVTSANFSGSAETSNVELGLRVEDPALVRGIEKQMAIFEETIYERVVL